MTVTREELAEFHNFANEKLSNGGAESMHALLDDWLMKRAHDASVTEIRQSIAQYEAGEALPVDQAFAEIRQKLGWTE